MPVLRAHQLKTGRWQICISAVPDNMLSEVHKNHYIKIISEQNELLVAALRRAWQQYAKRVFAEWHLIDNEHFAEVEFYDHNENLINPEFITSERLSFEVA